MKTPRRKVWDLVGEAQINDDGTSRQHVLSVLYPGEPLTLERQPENPFDANAIAVLAGRHQIGFIARDDAAELAPLLDARIPYRVQLHELTGGRPDYPSFGARICIAWRETQMLTPSPLDPGQTHHQQFLDAEGPAATNAAGKGLGCAIAGAVAFVTLGVMGATLV